MGNLDLTFVSLSFIQSQIERIFEKYYLIVGLFNSRERLYASFCLNRRLKSLIYESNFYCATLDQI